MTVRSALALALVALAWGQITPPPVFPLNIGQITLANSGAPAAQENFTNGVLLMLNFWYPLAITTFQEAQTIDPTFAMAYWGEAMSQMQFLWSVENVTLSASILDQIDMNWPMTPKEVAYINAARELFNVSLIEDRPQRLTNFIDAMGAMVPLYGHDDEIVNTTYGLARMSYYFWGYMDWNEWNQTEFWSVYSLFSELSVYNPQNPGAWHFIIHSCDDAFHYTYAEQAAFTYPTVAPSSSHAQHMPSHIFIRYGWWDLVVLRNVMAWAEQYEFCNLTGLSGANYDYHSNWFLMYGYIQLGQFDNALMTIGRLQEYLGPNPDAFAYLQDVSNDWGTMTGSYIVDSGRWSDAYAMLPPLMVCGDCLNYDAETDDGTYAATANSQMLMVRGMASAHLGNLSDVEWTLNEINTQMYAYAPFLAPMQLFNVSALQINATIASLAGDYASAIAFAQDAATIELGFGSPPSGPPIPVQPSVEFLGNMYYGAGQWELALATYTEMQALVPNRTNTLLGIARTNAQLCNVAVASATYNMLAEILSGADAGNAPLAEAQAYATSPWPATCTRPARPDVYHLSKGMIAAIVICGIGFLALVAVGVYRLSTANKRARREGYGRVQIE